MFACVFVMIKENVYLAKILHKYALMNVGRTRCKATQKVLELRASHLVDASRKKI